MSAPRWLNYPLAQPRDLPDQLATGFPPTAEASKASAHAELNSPRRPHGCAPGRRRRNSQPMRGKRLYDRIAPGRSDGHHAPRPACPGFRGTLNRRSSAMARPLSHSSMVAYHQLVVRQAGQKIAAHAASTNRKIVAALAELLPLPTRPPARPARGSRCGTSPTAPTWTTAPFESDAAYRHGSIAPAASKGTGCAPSRWPPERQVRARKPASPGRGSLGRSLPDHETRPGAPGLDRRSSRSRIPPCRDRGRGS